jgi:hypothetical protein
MKRMCVEDGVVNFIFSRLIVRKGILTMTRTFIRHQMGVGTVGLVVVKRP